MSGGGGGGGVSLLLLLLLLLLRLQWWRRRRWQLMLRRLLLLDDPGCISIQPRHDRETPGCDPSRLRQRARRARHDIRDPSRALGRAQRPVLVAVSAAPATMPVPFSLPRAGTVHRAVPLIGPHAFRFPVTMSRAVHALVPHPLSLVHPRRINGTGAAAGAAPLPPASAVSAPAAGSGGGGPVGGGAKRLAPADGPGGGGGASGRQVRGVRPVGVSPGAAVGRQWRPRRQKLTECRCTVLRVLWQRVMLHRCTMLRLRLTAVVVVPPAVSALVSALAPVATPGPAAAASAAAASAVLPRTPPLPARLHVAVIAAALRWRRQGPLPFRPHVALPIAAFVSGVVSAVFSAVVFQAVVFSPAVSAVSAVASAACTVG